MEKDKEYTIQDYIDDMEEYTKSFGGNFFLKEVYWMTPEEMLEEWIEGAKQYYTSVSDECREYILKDIKKYISQ